MKKIKFLLMVFLLSLLNSSSEALSDKGLLMAGKTSTPPEIDGELNDSCWQKSIEVSPFILMKQNLFAKEQTKIYLSYDEQNLYIAFWCGESCLDPVNNQLASFKKDTKENDDDKLFSDDCIIILLDTENTQNKFYDIFINGNGVINDAFCAGKNPQEWWSSRDKKWNSNAKISTKIENGYWTAELSIPFSSLKISPKEDDIWGICLGRIEKNKNERSVWQPMEIGFHNAKEFGKIVFGKEVCGIKSVKIGDFNFGKNRLTAKVVLPYPNTSLRIESSITFAKEKREVFYEDYKISQSKDLTFDYYLNKEGDFSFQYKILDPSTLEVYYRSPPYFATVKSSILKVKIDTRDKYKIYLNGEEISEQGPLYQGENVIAIETEGPISGKFLIGDFTFSIDAAWRYSPLEEKNWYKKEFDDHSWKQSPIKDNQLEKRGYLRKVILLSHSRFWPNWEKQGINIAQDSIQQLFLVPQGIKEKNLTDYNFVLEVPKGFKFLGASGYYGKSYNLKGFFAEEKGIVKRKNEDYQKYLITSLDPISFRDEIKSYQFCSILVQLSSSDKKEINFYYYLNLEKGYIQEVPQNLKVNILPPIKGKQPKKYVWQLWTGWLGNMDDSKLQEYLLKFFTKAGFNEVCFSYPIPEGINLKNVRLISFDEWNIDCKPYLSQHPEEALLDSKGKRRYIPGDRRNNQICTSLLLENSPAWEYVEKAIGDWIKKHKIDHVNWDYESNVYDSYISCYCSKCLNEFKKSAKVSPDIKLTPEIIKKDYRKEWIEFMNMKMAELAGKFRSAVKKYNPNTTFSVYSGYQSDSTKEGYGIDWNMLSNKIDLGMVGYGRPVKEIENTLKALGKIPLVCGELIYPYDEKSLDYPGFASKATLLRRATDGTGGILIYTLAELDGRTFYSASEIARLVSDYEDLFISHRKDNSLVKISGISADDVVVFIDNKKRLILIINEDKSEKIAKIINENFNEKMKTFDYYENKDLGNQKELTVNVLPEDVKVLVITEQ